MLVRMSVWEWQVATKLRLSLAGWTSSYVVSNMLDLRRPRCDSPHFKILPNEWVLRTKYPNRTFTCKLPTIHAAGLTLTLI